MSRAKKKKKDDIRWCDQGCGYKLPEEYAEDETTCGACLNSLDGLDEDWP